MPNRQAPALVLLDDDLQRELRSVDSISSMPRMDPEPAARPPPRTDFRSNQPPRTDFRSAPSTDFRSAPSTDFRSAPSTAPTAPPAGYEPRTDFRSNQPRTDFRTVESGATTKPATSTENAAGRSTDRSGSLGAYTSSSSPRTDFTSRMYAHAAGGNGYGGEFGAFRTSDAASSNADTADNSNGRANGYVGNSSTLQFSIPLTLGGVVLGLALGILMATLEVSDNLANWITLPGDLFLRAMNCLVVPYVFCSVAVAIGDIVFVGKVSIIGLQTAKVFGVLWVSTTVMGMAVALLFRTSFRLSSTYVATSTNSVGFMCPNGLMLRTSAVTGQVACNSTATTVGGAHQFTVNDVNDVFTKDETTVLADLSLSEQLIEIIDTVVPSNIFESMSESTLLSVITFAMVFGSIAGRNYFTKTRKINYLYQVLLQLRNTFFLGMEWIIWLSPVAVVFIIAGSFASNQDSVSQFKDVYLFVVANLVACILQMGLIFPIIVFFMTRCNPYTHMGHMLRAYLFSFGCASSLATAPVTLSCIKKARACSQSLANFVISIGVVTDISCMGFYCPIAIIFLAESSGNSDEITTLRLVLIFVLSLIACVGTPPIPSAGPVVVATMYKTVFGVSDLPSTWALYVAMDFFCDRIATVCNVNDDIMALKIIAENTDETILGDHLGERY